MKHAKHSINRSRGKTGQLARAGAAIALGLMASTAFAQADDMSQDSVSRLQQQIDSLNNQLDQLREQNNDSNVFFDKDSKSLHVGNTDITAGGFIELDMTEALSQDLGRAPNPLNIKTKHQSKGTGGGGHFQFQAQHSRLYLQSITHTDNGPIKAYVEGDFNGKGNEGGNAYGFQLRHAYLQWSHWTLGQTWSLFHDQFTPAQVDYFSTAGTSVLRQAQIRYTQMLNDTNSFAVSLENPNTKTLGYDPADKSGSSRIYNSNGQRDDDDAQNTAPDIHVRYLYKGDQLKLQANLMGARLKLHNAPSKDTTYGWAAKLGGAYTLPTNTTLYLMGTYGAGYNRYINGGQVNSYVKNNGDIKAVEAWTGLVGVKQKLSEKWFATASYSYVDQDDLDDANTFNPEDWVDHVSQGRVSAFYNPWNDLQLGASYVRSDAKFQDSEKGHANDLWFVAKYFF